MGGPTFDRQVFVKKQTTQKSPSKSPLPGGLVLVLVAALSAFATYRFVKAGGTAPENPADKAKIEELQGKLKTMQSHIDELESRRKAASAKRKRILFLIARFSLSVDRRSQATGVPIIKD